MSFAVEDFRDWLGILRQHPEWRAEPRRWMLSEELLALPQAVRELAEAQRRTEERISQLVQAQDGLAHQVSALVQQVSDLARPYEALSERRMPLPRENCPMWSLALHGRARSMAKRSGWLVIIPTRDDADASR